MAGNLLPAVPNQTNSYVQAAVEQIMGPYMGQISALAGKFDAALAQMCAQGAAGAGQVQRSMATTQFPPGSGPIPGGPGKPDCGCGGKCGGGGGTCSTGSCTPGKDPPPGWMPPDPGYPPGQPCNPLMPQGVTRGAIPLLNNLAPGCYNCACLDPCLYPALLFARQNFDAWQWANAMENDGELVHLNVNAGDAADFNVPPVPLVASSESLFAQQAQQVLPYIPGLVKVNVEWSGSKAPDAVELQFYTGPNPTVSGITAADLDAVNGEFAIAGRAFTLTDFECKDQCYVQEFPKIFKCTPGPIPYSRALYVRVTVGALPGNTTIQSLAITILKQGTRQYTNCCNDFRFAALGPSSGGGCGRVYNSDPGTMMWQSMFGLGV